MLRTKMQNKGKLAVAGILASTLLVQSAHAALIMEVRATDGTNTVTVNSAGNVTVNIYGIVTGSNQLSDEGLQSAYGSLVSGTGGLLGNLSAVSSAGNFNATVQGGTAFDNGSDSDTDRGSVNGGAAAAYVYLRAGSPQTVANGAGTAVTYQGAVGAQFLIGTATFAVTTLNAGTTISWIPQLSSATPPKAVLTSAVWTQDGGGTSNPGNAVYNASTSPYRSGQSLVINDTVVDGFTLTPTAANTNYGVVHVNSTNGANYYSEVKTIQGTPNIGSVTVDTAITAPTVVLLWLVDSDANNGATIASTLTDLNAASGGTYTVISSGVVYDGLAAKYGNDLTAAIAFNAPLASGAAFNWNFSNGHSDIGVDRIAVVPEPTTLGLVGLASGALLSRRKRRTV